ncbi:hypothetical protein [Methanosarcina sp.]|uniref:hypothetical protein n=1 Tax=Methanosarcina sp. TaxID=2213 RepID=UPI002ABBF6E9|nr:hypothetical protein [Methanosarcina sp.]MDY9927448.1 hypothetical protein [Methanosarcina sp.]
MLKRRTTGKWLMLTLSISILFCGFASASDDGSHDSESDKISDSIKEFANDPSFIAYRGTIPETIDQEWKNSIADCWLNLNRIGPSYSEFDISIKSVAASDVIIIELGSAYKGEIDDSRIDGMYQKIEEYCEKQEGISEIPIVFMWAQDEEDLPLPDYGPQIFEEIKNETGFIATRGTMPVITDSGEKMEWIDTLVNGKRSLPRSEYMPYFVEFGGPVTGFGPSINGYLTVGFDPSTPEKVNESVIDEIYQVIDEHFEQEGINEVPVVFEWIETPIEDEGLPVEDEGSDADEEMITIMGKDGNYITVDKDEVYIDKDGNYAIKDNGTTQKTNETTNKTPSFTSIMFVLGLLSLLIFKRL